MKRLKTQQENPGQAEADEGHAEGQYDDQETVSRLPERTRTFVNSDNARRFRYVAPAKREDRQRAVAALYALARKRNRSLASATARWRPLSDDEVRRFLDATARTPYYALYALLISTGIRPSEAIALRWKDLDLSRARMVVRRKLQRPSVSGHQHEFKTRLDELAIPLQPELAHLLSQARNHQELVFTDDFGEPLNLNVLIAKHFKPALERAGLNSRLRLDDLRYAPSTHLISAGTKN